MLDKTLGYILCCQSPGLFLAAAVLVIAYFADGRIPSDMRVFNCGV